MSNRSIYFDIEIVAAFPAGFRWMQEKKPGLFSLAAAIRNIDCVMGSGAPSDHRPVARKNSIFP